MVNSYKKTKFSYHIRALECILVGEDLFGHIRNRVEKYAHAKLSAAAESRPRLDIIESYAVLLER